MRRLVRAVFLVALCTPAILVASLRWIAPPTTGFMLWRTFERVAHGHSSYYPERRWVRLERFAPALRQAVLASEDQTFYIHHGFDFRQVGDALLKHGRRGASTISQQTSRNLFLWPGRSYIRKVLEAYLTVWIEVLLPKDRILELYLNIFECADGTFGAEACSLRYFRHPAAQLSAEEASRLVAVLPNPRHRSPLSPKSGERARQIRAEMQHPIPHPRASP